MRLGEVSLARGYFALQAVAVLAWWTVLFARPGLRAWFQPNDSAAATLLAFAPGDVIVLGAGGLAAATFSDGKRRARRLLAWLVAGAAIYAALYTLSLAVADAVPVLGAILMCPAAGASAYAAFLLDDDVRAVSSSGTG